MSTQTAQQSADSTVLAICKELLENIPEPCNLEDIKERFKFDSSPLKVVLIQETARYNKLLIYTRKSLHELERAINGEVLISEDLEKVQTSLSQGKIPTSWQFAYPSHKPLASWVRDLIERIKQIRTWATSQAPIIFWISGFTYPTGFTTALLQQAAAAKQCSIDSLSMDFAIIPGDEAGLVIPPREGAYIKGLYLESAKWNVADGILMEPEPMELNCPMPVIHFRPVKEKKKNKGVVYSCPCYYYSTREGSRERPSFMFYVDLKCGELGSDFWIKRGTALLMNLDS